MTTGIEWTDETWNPIVGCTHCSPGCDHCYAATLASGRLKNVPTYAGLATGGKFTGEVRLLFERIEQPLRWRAPRRVFVNSMSDLFHPDVPTTFIAHVFAIMSIAKQHTFQVLTKRPQHMAAMLNHRPFLRLMDDLRGAAAGDFTWPLPNVWLGTSVENQRYADMRIPHLLDAPAAVHFLSIEPLIGPVDLEEWTADRELSKSNLDWVIVGGESGSGARPMHPEWARDVRDECVDAGVSFLFKQWGNWKQVDRDRCTHLVHSRGAWPTEKIADDPDTCSWVVPRANATMDLPYGPTSGTNQDLVDRGHQGWVRMRNVGKKAAGRELDGRTWDEYPEANV